MESVIDTLEQAGDCLDGYEQLLLLLIDTGLLHETIEAPQNELNEVRGVADKLTVVIDQFKEAQKEVTAMLKALSTHDTEGEPVAHLVEEPASGEALSDSSSSEEDDLIRGGISDLVKRNVKSDSDSDFDESSEEEVRIGDRDGFGATFWQKKH